MTATPESAETSDIQASNQPTISSAAMDASPTAKAAFPVFPASALVGSIGEWSKIMSEGTEVPVEFYFASGLTVLGHIVGDRLTLDNQLHVRPQLYTVLLGETGLAKKSTALKETISFFQPLIGIKEVDVENAAVTRPQVCYGVGSAEGVAKLLGSGSQLLLACDELRALIDKSGVKGSVLLPMVTSLFEQNHYQNATKDRILRIDNALLSLLGCCTADTYEAMWTPEAISIGLPNRLFVVKANAGSRHAWPEARPDTTELQKRLTQQLGRLPSTGSLRFGITPDARVAWETWYNDMPASIHSTRLDSIGNRLMLLLALITDKDVIDLEVIKTVTAILDYEYAVRVATDPIDADNKTARMEERIRRVLASGQWVTRRDLWRQTHAARSGAFIFDSAVKNLETSCHEIQVQKKGGTRVKYRLVPAENDRAA
jgi:hypothetical protein